jgi:hypothetical protein
MTLYEWMSLPKTVLSRAHNKILAVVTALVELEDGYKCREAREVSHF